jgi:hypothetical protein
MWTPTFPGEGVHDYDQAQKAVSGFIRDTAGGRFIRGRGYIAVPELHPSGHGWHWHVLVGGPRCPKGQLRGLQKDWTRYLWEHARPDGWDGGPVRHHWKRFHSSRVVSRYAAKYVSKSFESGDVGPGRHRYLRGEHLESPPLLVARHRTIGEALETTGSPFSWTYTYSGWDVGRPLLYICKDPPEPYMWVR